MARRAKRTTTRKKSKSTSRPRAAASTANPAAGEPVLGRAIRQAPGSLRPHLVRLHAGPDERTGEGGETAGGLRDDGSWRGTGLREKLALAASESIFIGIVRLHRRVTDE